jgi:hypothetical protein
MKNPKPYQKLSLALLGLTFTLLPLATPTTANAQGTPKTETKPAVKVDKRLIDLPGYYATDTPNAPTMELTLSETGSLIMQVKGYPALTMMLNKKEQLTNSLLPAGYEFTVKRDKKKAIIGIEGKTPQGTMLYKKAEKPVEVIKPAEKVAEKPAEKAVEKVEVPDILGKYEPAEAGPIGPVEIVLRDGKIFTVAEGQPEFNVKVKGDAVLCDEFPDGITVTLKRDADKKVIGFTIKMAEGEILMNRKTFVAVPKVEEKKEEPKKEEDAKLARLKATEGTYTPDTPGVPKIEMKVKDGKLMMAAEGFPELEVEITDKDILKSEMLPEGFVLTLIRDKDGVVTGLKADTPMGVATFTRKPA